MDTSPKRARTKTVKNTSYPLDLYEAGDNLAPNSFVEKRVGQTATHSDRILPSDYLKVVKSGWRKPSIQLGAILYLRDRGDLNLNGERRLHKLLKNISSEEISAAFRHKEKISKFPEAFGPLLRWCTRPLHFRPYHKKEKRRIGVGYRDKGSLPPSHSRHRVFGEQDLLYLGEEKEFLDLNHPVFAHLGRCLNGVLLFQHVSDGWWRILTPRERFERAQLMLSQALTRY